MSRPCAVLPGSAHPRARRSAADRFHGAAGIIRAIEECFPRSARQRCLARRMRNLAAKVPTDLWPKFKTRVAACYQAPLWAIARQLAAGIRADYADVLPSAFICFDDDFGASSPTCARSRIGARQDDQPARTAVR